MQPYPMAETSRPCWLSCRFSRRMYLLLLPWDVRLGLFLEDFLRDPDGKHRPRPPGVEGQVGDDLDEIGLREAVLPGPVQVARELLRVSAGGERGDGDKAAIARRELLARPHVPEQDVVCELHELGREVTDHFLSGGRLFIQTVCSFHCLTAACPAKSAAPGCVCP